MLSTVTEVLLVSEAALKRLLLHQAAAHTRAAISTRAVNAATSGVSRGCQVQTNMPCCSKNPGLQTLPISSHNGGSSTTNTAALTPALRTVQLAPLAIHFTGGRASMMDSSANGTAAVWCVKQPTRGGCRSAAHVLPSSLLTDSPELPGRPVGAAYDHGGLPASCPGPKQQMTRHRRPQRPPCWLQSPRPLQAGGDESGRSKAPIGHELATQVSCTS